MERRVHLRRGAARHPARHDPGDRADRDDPGRVRDGRDPLRAARHASGLNAGPLGLPVQHHQVLPRRRAGVRAARPGRGDDDGAVHAGVHRAAGHDLPPARRVRDRRHGRVHPEPARPGGQRAAFAKVREDKEREAGDGFDGSWVAHPDLVPVCREVFDGVLGDRPNQLDRLPRRRRGDRRPTCSTSRATPGAVTEAGLRDNVAVGAAVPGGLAARQRRGRRSTT